jgi:hypothetical protein
MLELEDSISILRIVIVLCSRAPTRVRGIEPKGTIVHAQKKIFGSINYNILM